MSCHLLHQYLQRSMLTQRLNSLGGSRPGTYRGQHYRQHHGENEHEAQHPPARFPLVLVRRRQLIRSRRRILRDRGDVGLDVVCWGIAAQASVFVQPEGNEPRTEHVPLLDDNGAQIPEYGVELVDSLFDLPDLRLAFGDHRFLEG